MDGRSMHARGLAIVTLGVLILTPDALLIRLIRVDHWTLLVWRGYLQGLGMFLLLLAVYRRDTLASFKAIGIRGLAATLAFATGTVLFIVALTYTSAANVLIIVASSPFFAALASRVFLAEQIATATWVAILVALGGIGLLGFEGLGHSAFLGDLAALGVAVTLGANFTILRHARRVNMIPAMALSGLLVGLVASPLAQPVELGQSQLIYLLIMGLFVVPVSFALITLGPRYLPAPEVSLLLLLETVLGPLWVWLVIGEAPGPLALAGGAVVVATLAAHSALALRQKVRAGS